MSFSKNRFLLIVSLLSFSFPAFSQVSSSEELPRVFLIGEYEDQYEQVLVNYQETMLSVCGNDMEKAFDLWMSFSQELEAFAKRINYDLSGVKAWMHVLFDPNGKVDYLAYHLKPDSRNVDTVELTAVINSFVEFYQLPLTARTNYAIYTGVQFPTYYLLPNGENGN